LKSSSEHSQQNPHINIRKSQEEKGQQQSSFNVFHAVTCVRVDGWAVQSSEKKGRMNGNFSNIVLRKAKFDSMVT